MRTKLADGNPFGHDRYGFLWEKLSRRRPGSHLDFGAFNGQTISELRRSGVIRTGVGLDVNREVVNAHRGEMPAGVDLVAVQKGNPLPFDAETFDSASVLDVIEHIYDQAAVLRELHRVLRPDGLLVITVPRRHVFSFLDIGNLKFTFPALHRVYYTARYSDESYRTRYSHSPDGLVGDIEREKGWHQHFSSVELTELLAGCGFQTIEIDGSGLLGRPLAILHHFSPGPARRVWERILRADARFFESTNLFCLAAKTGTSMASEPNGSNPPSSRR